MYIIYNNGWNIISVHKFKQIYFTIVIKQSKVVVYKYFINISNNRGLVV